MTYVTPVVLEGTAYDRGFEYGARLKPAIVEAVTRFKYQITHVTGLDAGDVCARFLDTTRFIAAVERWTPGPWQELHGLADACRIPLADLFLLQCQDEIQWWFRELVAPPPAAGGQRCSAIGIPLTGTDASIVAQNLDHHVIYDGLQCLLHVKDTATGGESYLLSFAGLLALNGVNHDGVGIVCNALHRYLHNRRDGLPVTFVLRGVLERSTLEHALAFIRSIPHASGQNYIVGDRRAVACVECSANQVASYLPDAAHGRTYHTNHPLVSGDVAHPAERGPHAGTTFDRLDYLAARLGPAIPMVDVDAVKYILSAHQGPAPICVHHGGQPDRNFTLGSTVYVLSDPVEAHVTLGPPCTRPYQVLTLPSSRTAGTP